MLLAAAAPAPLAYDAFGPAQPVTIAGYAGDAMEPFVSPDGRYLLFNNRNDPPQKTDLFCAERAGGARAFRFRGPIVGANSPALDGVPSLDAAGELFFITTRSYAKDLATVYRARFADCAAGGVVRVPGVRPPSPGFVDFDAAISPDGQSLYVAEGDFRGADPKPHTARIVLFRRSGAAFIPDPASETLLAAVNDGGLNYAPAISSDGRELFFTRLAQMAPGAVPQILRAAREAPDAPFAPPQPVATASGFAEAPSLSADARRLYFHRRLGASYALFEAER
jgi:hypothetical protein